MLNLMFSTVTNSNVASFSLQNHRLRHRVTLWSCFKGVWSLLDTQCTALERCYTSNNEAGAAALCFRKKRTMVLEVCVCATVLTVKDRKEEKSVPSSYLESLANTLSRITTNWEREEKKHSSGITLLMEMRFTILFTILFYGHFKSSWVSL